MHWPLLNALHWPLLSVMMQQVMLDQLKLRDKQAVHCILHDNVTAIAVYKQFKEVFSRLWLAFGWPLGGLNILKCYI